MLVTSIFSPHAVVPLCHTQKMTGTTATPTFRGQIVPSVPASLLVPGQKRLPVHGWGQRGFKVRGACSGRPLLTAVHTESLLGNACRQPFPVLPGLRSATLKTQGPLADLSKAVDRGLGAADFADERLLTEPFGD